MAKSAIQCFLPLLIYKTMGKSSGGTRSSSSSSPKGLTEAQENISMATRSIPQLVYDIREELRGMGLAFNTSFRIDTENHIITNTRLGGKLTLSFDREFRENNLKKDTLFEILNELKNKSNVQVSTGRFS